MNKSKDENKTVKRVNNVSYSLRTTEDVSQELDRLFAKHGLSGHKILPYVLQMFKLQEIKETMPELGATIDAFKANNKTTIELFNGMLAIANKTKEMTKDECEMELKSKDKTILGLQKELEVAQDEAQALTETKDELEKKVEALTNENKQLKKEVARLNDTIHENHVMLETLQEIVRIVKEQAEEKNVQTKK